MKINNVKIISNSKHQIVLWYILQTKRSFNTVGKSQFNRKPSRLVRIENRGALNSIIFIT